MSAVFSESQMCYELTKTVPCWITVMIGWPDFTVEWMSSIIAAPAISAFHIPCSPVGNELNKISIIHQRSINCAQACYHSWYATPENKSYKSCSEKPLCNMWLMQFKTSFNLSLILCITVLVKSNNCIWLDRWYFDFKYDSLNVICIPSCLVKLRMSH